MITRNALPLVSILRNHPTPTTTITPNPTIPNSTIVTTNQQTNNYLSLRLAYTYRSQQKFIDFRKDYYEILEIDEGATFQEIKQKFYHLAKEYHPDRNKGKEGKFKEINEAYNILSQPHLRSDYDSNRNKAYQTQKGDSLRDEKGGKSSLNYGAYSQLSRAEWAMYRSGFMRQNKVDYTNYTLRFDQESNNDYEIRKREQWMRAFRAMTVEQLKEEAQFRAKLYKKYEEDVQTQLRAREQYIERRLCAIGEKIEKIFGKRVRSVYDRLIKK